jgi:hypothetical protein
MAQSVRKQTQWRRFFSKQDNYLRDRKVDSMNAYKNMIFGVFRVG